MTTVGDAEAVLELDVVEEAVEDVEDVEFFDDELEEELLELVELTLELEVELLVLDVVEFVYVPIELLLLLEVMEPDTELLVDDSEEVSAVD